MFNQSQRSLVVFLTMRSNRKQGIILTFDKDFGDLVYQKQLQPFGVILVRIAGIPAEVKTQRLVE